MGGGVYTDFKYAGTLFPRPLWETLSWALFTGEGGRDYAGYATTSGQLKFELKIKQKNKNKINI
jgi:hypothetical protein